MLKTLQGAALVRRLLFIVLILALQACVQQANRHKFKQDPEIAHEVRQEAISKIAQWKMQARIAIQTQTDSNTGSLRWRQSAQALELDLKGPFGVNVAKIKGGEGSYTLRDRQGDIWQAANIDQLIYNRTGWALPVRQLRYWVLADTQNKNNASYVHNEDGTLASLQYGPWQIQYEKYIQVNEISLPAKVRIQHPEISIKLLIKEWETKRD